MVKTGDEQLISFSVPCPSTLSELIARRLSKDGCRFIVADFSAGRAYWRLANEEWVLENSRQGQDLQATSRMFHIPGDHRQGQSDYEYRQKGKQATLSCVQKALVPRIMG